jgi:SAM-dependent methyltransferase
MAGQGRREIGRLFNEVPELYDRVRPTYPDELFADLVAVTGVHEGSPVLEVGCGTGQAMRSLAALGFSLTAVEPGAGMASLARHRVASRLWSGGQRAELLEKIELFKSPPVFDDSTLPNAPDLVSHHSAPPARRRDAQQRAKLGSPDNHAGDDGCSLGEGVGQSHVEVGERGVQSVNVSDRAGRVG